jgi:hypothetical protein
MAGMLPLRKVMTEKGERISFSGHPVLGRKHVNTAVLVGGAGSSINCLIHQNVFTVPLIQYLSNRTRNIPDGERFHNEFTDSQ